MGSSSGQSSESYDHSFKIVLIGGSGVGKSSLAVSFISDSAADLATTIGVDLNIKLLTVGGKRLKLTIWDTVYDVTERETFTSLSDVWAKEVELYSTNKDCVKMLVGNKVDRDPERAVSREEGTALAKELGCMFLECSTKTRQNVERCFEELALKMMEAPSLSQEGSAEGKQNIIEPKPAAEGKQNIIEPKPAYTSPPKGDCCSCQ